MRRHKMFIQLTFVLYFALIGVIAWDDYCASH